MVRTVCGVVLALAASSAWAEPKAKPQPKTTPQTPARTEAARIAQPIFAGLPADKMTAAAGFFGPVTKKYLPVYQNLEREFLAATNKLAVLKKYLPQAQKALEEARAMKVSAKFDAEKAEYIRMFESALFYAQAAIQMANLQEAAKKSPTKSR